MIDVSVSDWLDSSAARPAYAESVKAVPPTCAIVQDVIDHLVDKYKISEDDRAFALSIIQGRTKALRRALVLAIGRPEETR